MIGIGFAIGFRFQEGIFSALAMVGLILLFGYAFSWIMAFVGMTVKDSETAQVAGFPIVFPLLFASSAFVPLQTMPGWLQVQAFANNQLVTHLICRRNSPSGSSGLKSPSHLSASNPS